MEDQGLIRRAERCPYIARVRRTALASGLITRLIGRGLSPLYLIVDKAAGEPCSRADAGAKPGIPAMAPMIAPPSGADRRPGKSALLRRVRPRSPPAGPRLPQPLKSTFSFLDAFALTPINV
jgi:hypothetical protein